MDSKQLFAILNNDTYVRQSNFLGVFALDLIPFQAVKSPCCFIANNKKSNNSGEHWVAVFKTEDNVGVYFDSMGYSPYTLPEIADVLEPCDKVIWNEQQLQSHFSTVCGDYCIFFLIHMAKNYSLEIIVNLLNDAGDVFSNDALIYSYIRERYPESDIKNLSIVDYPFIFSQLAQNINNKSS